MSAQPNPISHDESRRVVYQEICKSHGAIADFRAKLLALLPAASGASVFVLLIKNHTESFRKLLGPLGLFGFVAIFGLFMYELRGIEDCVTLRKRAEEIEEKLHIPFGESQFHRDRGKLGGLADEVGAGWIVYTAVLTSWLYVAGKGFDVLGKGFNLNEKFGWGAWPLLLVIVYLGVLALALCPPWYFAARLAGVNPPRSFRPGDPVFVCRPGRKPESAIFDLRVPSRTPLTAKVTLVRRSGRVPDVVPERLLRFQYGIRGMLRRLTR